jgi:hypothetical protein
MAPGSHHSFTLITITGVSRQDFVIHKESAGVQDGGIYSTANLDGQNSTIMTKSVAQQIVQAVTACWLAASKQEEQMKGKINKRNRYGCMATGVLW